MRDKKQRLFFALWPPVPVRESIVKIASPLLHKMHGRIIQPKNLHITLHFIGLVDEDRKDCLHKAAQSIIAQPFKLSLDCFGYFRTAKIFWMTAQNLPAEINMLHHDLGEALSVCDFHSDSRPYAPHVTLLKKCANPVMKYEGSPVPWTVNEFVLVESTQDEKGMNYQIIEKYPML